MAHVYIHAPLTAPARTPQTGFQEYVCDGLEFQCRSLCQNNAAISFTKMDPQHRGLYRD